MGGKSIQYLRPCSGSKVDNHGRVNAVKWLMKHCHHAGPVEWTEFLSTNSCSSLKDFIKYPILLDFSAPGKGEGLPETLQTQLTTNLPPSHSELRVSWWRPTGWKKTYFQLEADTCAAFRLNIDEISWNQPCTCINRTELSETFNFGLQLVLFPRLCMWPQCVFLMSSLHAAHSADRLMLIEFIRNLLSILLSVQYLCSAKNFSGIILSNSKIDCLISQIFRYLILHIEDDSTVRLQIPNRNK